MRSDDNNRRINDNGYAADGQKRSDFSEHGIQPEYNDDSNEIIIGGSVDDIDLDDYAQRLERRASKPQSKPRIEYQNDGYPSRRDRKRLMQERHEQAAAEEAAAEVTAVVSEAANDLKAAPADIIENTADVAAKAEEAVEDIAEVAAETEEVIDDVAEVAAEAEEAVEEVAEVAAETVAARPKDILDEILGDSAAPEQEISMTYGEAESFDDEPEEEYADSDEYTDDVDSDEEYEYDEAEIPQDAEWYDEDDENVDGSDEEYDGAEEEYFAEEGEEEYTDEGEEEYYDEGEEEYYEDEQDEYPEEADEYYDEEFDENWENGALDENGLPIPLVKPRNLDAVRRAREAAREAAEDNDDSGFLKEFLVSASPHIHCGETTRVIMGDVVIALIPALIASVLWFGWRALMLSAVCVISCVATEFVCRKIMHRSQTIGDFSAVVTGLLLAFSLPPELNPLFAVIGSVVAIAVVKQMFGGIGMNFANPAVTARIVMMLSFPAAMTTWSRPFYYYLDAMTQATPLAMLSDPNAQLPTYTELLVGYHGGCIGETCAVALLLGGAYLLLRGVISWEIPVSFMGTVAIFSLLVGQDPLYQLLTGGVILGAVFMATDYVTSPINSKGRIIFGIGCGLFTMLIRLYGNMPEGVSFAILLMNILTPHIDRLTLSIPFGEERE